MNIKRLLLGITIIALILCPVMYARRGGGGGGGSRGGGGRPARSAGSRSSRSHSRTPRHDNHRRYDHHHNYHGPYSYGWWDSGPYRGYDFVFVSWAESAQINELYARLHELQEQNSQMANASAEEREKLQQQIDILQTQIAARERNK